MYFFLNSSLYLKFWNWQLHANERVNKHTITNCKIPTRIHLLTKHKVTTKNHPKYSKTRTCHIISGHLGRSCTCCTFLKSLYSFIHTNLHNGILKLMFFSIILNIILFLHLRNKFLKTTKQVHFLGSSLQTQTNKRRKNKQIFGKQ